MLRGMSQSRARAARRQSPPPRRRAPRIVRAAGPADLLRHIPDLLPAEPEDSLVLVLFAGGPGTVSRTAGAMRVDLLHTEDPAPLRAWSASLLGRALLVEGVTGVAAAAYTPDAFAPSGRPPAAAQLRAVCRQAERMGLEVQGRFVVAADGWGSLDDPELPRGGHPLALLEPDGPRPARRRGVVARPARAPEDEHERFLAQYVDWWQRPEGPGGVLHGVTLGERSAPRPAACPAAPSDPPGPEAEPSAMDRYRYGGDLDRLVELIEGVLAPHEDTDRPCACRALLLALVERQGLIPMLLGQVGWGPAFGRELWTAFAAPAGRERTGERLRAALGGSRFRRPDRDRVDAAVAALQEVAAHIDLPRHGAAVDEALAWLHWACGASSTAGALAERALRQHADRDLAPMLLDRVRRGVLPDWAYREDPSRPDPFDALLTPPRTG